MSGQHCENYDVKRKTVHCYRRNVDRCCTWALESQRGFQIFCFCFVLLYNKSHNDWSLGEQWILFPSEILGNKIHRSPRDQSLSVKYIWILVLYLRSNQFLIGVPSIIRRRKLKPALSVWKLFKCFPSTLRWGIWKLNNHPSFGFVFQENSVREITWLSGRLVFEKLRLRCFSSTLKCKASVFKFIRFEEQFRKAPFWWRISVDGRPNHRNKVMFLNLSSVLWTGP